MRMMDEDRRLRLAKPLGTILSSKKPTVSGEGDTNSIASVKRTWLEFLRLDLKIYSVVKPIRWASI